MPVYYALSNKHRLMCPVMNRHLIYLCIFKVQKKIDLPHQIAGITEAAMRNIKGIKMGYWQSWRLSRGKEPVLAFWLRTWQPKEARSVLLTQSKNHLCPLRRWLLWAPRCFHSAWLGWETLRLCGSGLLVLQRRTNNQIPELRFTERRGRSRLTCF